MRRTISVSLKEETVLEIDRQRALAKRSTYVQMLLERALGRLATRDDFS